MSRFTDLFQEPVSAPVPAPTTISEPVQVEKTVIKQVAVVQKSDKKESGTD